MSRPKVIFLDFDGVLAIPYSNPVELYPQTAGLLATLAKNYTLCLASFNPTAIKELRRLNVLQYFTACRAGSLINEEIIEYKKDLGELCKHKQIASICHQLDHADGAHDYYFFDDDPGNIGRVQSLAEHITSILVDNTVGLTLDTVGLTLDTVGLTLDTVLTILHTSPEQSS